MCMQNASQSSMTSRQSLRAFAPSAGCRFLRTNFEQRISKGPMCMAYVANRCPTTLAIAPSAPCRFLTVRLISISTAAQAGNGENMRGWPPTACGSFWMGWHREWEEKAPRPMEFELCSRPCRAFNQPRIYVFMFCIVCFGGDESPQPLQW